MEFRGTKGSLELKYVSGICIGIGIVGRYSQITANSILPETDEEYLMEKQEIESNMLLYSKAPEMLKILKKIRHRYKMQPDFEKEVDLLIKEATEL